MLTEICIEAHLADEDLTDQVVAAALNGEPLAIQEIARAIDE